MSNDTPETIPQREDSFSVVRTLLPYVIYAALLVVWWFLSPILLELWRGSDAWASALWIAYVAIMIGILWGVRKRSLARWDRACVEKRGLVIPNWARRIMPACEISFAASLGVLGTYSIDRAYGLQFVHVAALLTCIVMGGLGWFIKWWAELDGWKSKGSA